LTKPGYTAERPAALLLDAHIWFWYLTGSPRLPRGLRTAERSLQGVWLSPVSIWELGMLARYGRIRLEGSLRDWVEAAQVHLPVQDAPLNAEVAVTSLETNLPH
jgi:PIN domain nuclease of toxin-antitoxin system